MTFTTEKVFDVCYNDLHEAHTCGQIRLDNGQTIGRYSGNIFDGYRCIIKTDNHRAYIGGATLLHLRRLVWNHLVDIDFVIK